MYTHGRAKASGYSSLSALRKTPSFLTSGHHTFDTMMPFNYSLPHPPSPHSGLLYEKKRVSTLHKHLRKNSQHFPSQANNIFLHKEKGIYNIFNGEKCGFSNYLTTPGLCLKALLVAAAQELNQLTYDSV